MATKRLHIDQYNDKWRFEIDDEEIGAVSVYTGSNCLKTILTEKQLLDYYSDVTNIFRVSDKRIEEFKKVYQEYKDNKR